MPLDMKDFPVEEHQLPNGLRIRLLRDPQLPVCSLYSFFRVGSRNERPGITGISHLFEHMMFNGSRKYGCVFVILCFVAHFLSFSACQPI